jgi:hypothetical protein
MEKLTIGGDCDSWSAGLAAEVARLLGIGL